jgi:hypothetical protein
MGFAVCAHVYGEIQVFPGNGDGTFQPALTFPAGGSCNSLAVGRLGSHNRVDIVSANSNNIVVLINSAE